MKIFRIIEIIAGFILLIPPLLSVFLFLINVYDLNPGSISKLEGIESLTWTGDYYVDNDGGGAGYQSPIPIYLGLMAIGGAYLIKGK